MSIGPTSTTNRHVNGMTHILNIRQVDKYLVLFSWFLDCTNFQRKKYYLKSEILQCS